MNCCAEITVAARASALSKAQVKEVLEELQLHHPDIKFSPVWIESKGDKDLTTSLRHLEKTTFFTQEIDEMVQQHQCRIAIHSAKDLPDPLPASLSIIALTAGVDPSDSLVLPSGCTLDQLPLGAKIGTSSLRREANIKALRSDLQPVDIRGTIQRRLQLLDQNKLDGVIIAEAALIRLQLTALNRISLNGEQAAFQGQLAIIAREDDLEMKHLFSSIDVRK